jgi:hypothetical protein
VLRAQPEKEGARGDFLTEILVNLRLLIFAYLLLMLIDPMSLSAGEPNPSTVKVADLPVYSDSSISSQVVKTLHQGDRVIVEFEILTGYSWCKIREENRTEKSGYVMCQGLNRPQSASPKQWNQVASQSPGTAAEATLPKKSDADTPAVKSNPQRSVRDPYLWADRFHFSDEQRRTGTALLESSGVAGCEAGVEKMFRKSGISDPSSFLATLVGFGKSITGMREIARMGAELDRCGATYSAFWSGFVKLLNSDQQAQLAKEPAFLLFLSSLNSDPGTEFGFYVLSQMKSR